METDVAAPEHHISGLYTNMLMDSLAARLPEGAIRNVLQRAGETRSLQELKTSSSWNSYDQFKRLLQEARVELDSTPGARNGAPNRSG